MKRSRLVRWTIITILLSGALLLVTREMGLGHGMVDVPVLIESTDRDVMHVEYRLWHSLHFGFDETKNLHLWHDLTQDAGGEYSFRLPLSVSSSKWFWQERKYSYLHSAGVEIRIEFEDGGQLSVKCPLQEHPRKNIIEIKLTSS